MHDMVKIDTIVIEIVNCLKYPGSYRLRQGISLDSYLASDMTYIENLSLMLTH